MEDSNLPYHVWPLNCSVPENVRIPADKKLYFYIRIQVKFSRLNIFKLDLTNKFMNHERIGETQRWLMIPRKNLLSEDEQDWRTTISKMVFNEGAEVNGDMLQQIQDAAKEMVTDTQNLDKKILPINVIVWVKYVARNYICNHTLTGLSTRYYEGVDNIEDLRNVMDDGVDEGDSSESESEDEEEEYEEMEMEMKEEMRRSYIDMEVCFPEDLVGGENCTICLDELRSDEKELKRTGCCRQVFHDECIQTWLTLNNSCPLCRFQKST